MVDRGAAAGEGQLGEADQRGTPLPLAVHMCPDRIELLEPAEQALLLRPRPGEDLVEVVVGIDQAGDRDQAAPVDALDVALGRGLALPDPRDGALIDQDRRVGELGAGIIHHGHPPTRLDQDHGVGRLSRPAASVTASMIFS